LRLAGAILVVPAVGYVALLFSTVLGGPTIQSPLLPLPAPPPAAAVQARQPQPVPASGPTRPVADRVSAAQQPGALTPTTAGPLPAVTPTPSATPLTLPMTAPSPSPTANGRTTLSPAPTRTAPGKPAGLPTPTRRPLKL